ncbi:MAG: AEC family transporter [Clostridia bacterium]|nr:AEC family transporter [Clostridia bacterium]
MDFTSLLNTIATLFILMIAGVIASKCNIIDEIASKRLSKLILSIGQPLLIINSLLGVEYSTDNLLLGLKTLGAGFIVHGIIAVIAYFCCVKFKDFDEKKISEFAIVFGNVGFIGFPILESLFGKRGLFMGAFFVISFNIVLWTWGVAILARKRNDIKLTVKKVIFNYGTVPSAIGIFIYILNINLPTFVTMSASYLASLCTPISVLITGALLAHQSLKQIFLSPKVYYVSFVKLILIPLVICGLTKLIGLNYEWILFLTTVSAMPSATSAAMMSELHDITPGYAAEVVGTTSLLSIATMPCMLWLADKIAVL